MFFLYYLIIHNATHLFELCVCLSGKLLVCGPKLQCYKTVATTSNANKDESSIKMCYVIRIQLLFQSNQKWPPYKNAWHSSSLS